MNNKSIIKKAFLSTIPVFAGYEVLGMGFGILLRTKGYDIIWAFLMSVFIFAGSMQYVAINLLTGGASFITSAITTLMVNARHLFYGISMIDKYKDTGLYKPYLIFALSDETYSLNVSHEQSGDKKEDAKYYFFVSIFDQFYWVTGSVIGAILGGALPFDSTGIDFSLTALFLTIFVEQWKSTHNHLFAILGVVITLVCRIIFGTGNFLIPSMIVLTIALLLVKKKEEKVNV